MHVREPHKHKCVEGAHRQQLVSGEGVNGREAAERRRDEAAAERDAEHRAHPRQVHGAPSAHVLAGVVEAALVDEHVHDTTDAHGAAGPRECALGGVAAADAATRRGVRGGEMCFEAADFLGAQEAQRFERDGGVGEGSLRGGWHACGPVVAMTVVNIGIKGSKAPV